MRTLILSLVFFATSTPAFAEEPAAESAEDPDLIPAGSRFYQGADGTIFMTPSSQVETENEIAAKQAATENKIRMMAAREIADPTTNGSVIGRPAVTSNDVCGFAMNLEAFSGRQQRKLAELYPECVRAQAEFVDAQGRAVNTALALTLDRDFASEGDESATGNAAAISAVTDDEGGSMGGFGNMGVAGLPYGQSVVGVFQQNATQLQALMALQMGGANNTQPTGGNIKSPPVAPAITTTTEAVDAAQAAFKRACEAGGKTWSGGTCH